MNDSSINPESIALMLSLLDRRDTADQARAAFRQAHPDAPSSMIDAAVHHVVTDGVGATVDWLAAIEQFIRNPDHGLDYGAVWHAVYHLYNWLQLQALMPLGRDGLKENLNDLKALLQENDTESALHLLKGLTDSIEGQLRPPDLD